MKQAHQFSRRTLLRAGVGAGLLVLPFSRARGQSPNNKLNIAIIGVGGRGGSNLSGVSGENIVALCDVNANNLAAAAKKFPNAKTYVDWRQCLDHQEWLNGCKTGSPTLCNFDYSGALIEHNLLALVAYRAGTKLQWDAANLKATNCPEADQFIRKTYRDGWTLNG
jgi:hypothetical protein